MLVLGFEHQNGKHVLCTCAKQERNGKPTPRLSEMAAKGESTLYKTFFSRYLLLPCNIQSRGTLRISISAIGTSPLP